VSTTAIHTGSIMRGYIPIENTAWTHKESWQELGIQVTQDEIKKARRFTTDTSVETKWLGSLGSTSSIQEQEERIRENLKTLFQIHAYEDFEDGMQSEFVDELILYILKYGSRAVNAISSIILTESAKPQVIFEALRWLGRLTHPMSYYSRLFLLERSLLSSSRWIRDGAALGLASMKDTHAIPYLREAANKEKIQDLRRDMEDVLAHLESLH
jgi:HEAT repeat protein